MESLPQDDKQPIRFVITDDPKPVIEVEGVDITHAIHSLRFEIDGERGCWVHLIAKADIVADLGLDGVVTERAVEFEGLTAEAINNAIVMGGVSETPGAKVMAYLVEIGLVDPSLS